MKRMLGKRRYESRPQDFKEMDDVKPTLLQVESASVPLRDQFDSIYRRGLMEPRTYTRLKKSRMPKIKYHNRKNLTWKERNEGGEKFGLKFMN